MGSLRNFQHNEWMILQVSVLSQLHFQIPWFHKTQISYTLCIVLMPKPLLAKTEGRQACSHFCLNSVDNNVLCQADTKLNYLIIATIHTRNSQFPSLVKSFHCQKHAKMSKRFNTEPYPQRV